MGRGTTVRYVLGGILSITCAACSNGGGTIRTQAPQSRAELGLLVEGVESKDIDALLASERKVSVRKINDRHQLYEIYGMSETELRQKIKATHIENNAFVERAPAAQSGPVLFNANGRGPKYGKLNPCKKDSQTPTPVIKFETSLKPMDEQQAAFGVHLELGGKVQMSALQSHAHSDFPSTLKFAYLVDPPRNSKVTKTPHDGEQFSFAPDAVGAYQVALVAQDERDVCAAVVARFLVTANPPYQGPNVARIQPNLSIFNHLSPVRAEAAWKISEGKGITIAVIDSGVNYNHPSLASTIATNSKEIPGNGKDDDGNGFIDDLIGYDFVNSDGLPFDDDGHGSHVAGLAAGHGFGMAPLAKILPIKAMTSVGGDIATVAAAVKYAVDQGAQVINLSLGGMGRRPHPAIVRAMDYAEQKGALVVAAAGNGDPMSGLGLNIDLHKAFPASLTNASLVVVASSDPQNGLASYSNYGQESVDIVAPGGLPPKNLLVSATTQNAHGTAFEALFGTSMAAPVVSGIAAQVWSLAPQLSAVQVKEILKSAGQEVARLKLLTTSGRQIDAVSALELTRQNIVSF